MAELHILLQTVSYSWTNHQRCKKTMQKYLNLSLAVLLDIVHGLLRGVHYVFTNNLSKEENHERVYRYPFILLCTERNDSHAVKLIFMQEPCMSASWTKMDKLFITKIFHTVRSDSCKP